MRRGRVPVRCPSSPSSPVWRDETPSQAAAARSTVSPIPSCMTPHRASRRPPCRPCLDVSPRRNSPLTCHRDGRRDGRGETGRLGTPCHALFLCAAASGTRGRRASLPSRPSCCSVLSLHASAARPAGQSDQRSQPATARRRRADGEAWRAMCAPTPHRLAGAGAGARRRYGTRLVWDRVETRRAGPARPIAAPVRDEPALTSSWSHVGKTTAG